jgi:hypothetical protein
MKIPFWRKPEKLEEPEPVTPVAPSKNPAADLVSSRMLVEGLFERGIDAGLPRDSMPTLTHLVLVSLIRGEPVFHPNSGRIRVDRDTVVDLLPKAVSSHEVDAAVTHGLSAAQLEKLTPVVVIPKPPKPVAVVSQPSAPDVKPDDKKVEEKKTDAPWRDKAKTNGASATAGPKGNLP